MTIKRQNKKSNLPHSFRLEAERSGNIIRMDVCGVVGISDYSEEEIMLVSHSGKISVKGLALRVIVLEENTVEIQGRVKEVSFIYGKYGKN